MIKKIKIAILYGGKSAEHEVSLQSAKNVFDAIDREKYEPIQIMVDKTGEWLLNCKRVALIPGCKGELLFLSDADKKIKFDVVFPVMHGTFCEDGTLQGLLRLAEVPFIGASVLGSAVGMDKDVMKRLLRDAGVEIGKFICIKRNDNITFDEVKEILGLPFFVKPANLGSSIGINKVHDKDEFKEAIKDAFLYDTKIIIEENIKGREIECSVLGNDNPIASVSGEVCFGQDFYSYKAKYSDDQSAVLKIPADISEEKQNEVKKLAIKVFKTLCCEGMGRVDMFLRDDGRLIVNEINTIPGFTSKSMYPKLWEASGISYSELIDRLIVLALERFENERQLKVCL